MYNFVSRAASEGRRDLSSHYGVCARDWLLVDSYKVLPISRKKKDSCRVVSVPKEQKEKKSRTPKVGRTTKRHEVWTQEDKDVFFEALAEVEFRFSQNCGVADNLVTANKRSCEKVIFPQASV